MRLFILFIYVLLFSSEGYTQALPMKVLLKLQKMEQADIHKKLSSKGWSFLSNAEPDSKILGKAVWAFNPSGEGAEAWVILYYSDTTPNRILYNITEGKSISKIRKKLKRGRMTVIDEGDSLERIDYVKHYIDYADDVYVMRFFTYKQPNYYGIKIFRKEDYEKAKVNNRL